MGCDYTIHVGEIPIKSRRTDPLSLMIGNTVEIDNDLAIKQPNITIGECSFLKAGFPIEGGADRYIPKPIQLMCDLIPASQEARTVFISDELIGAIEKTYEQPNQTSYRMTSKERVLDFLREHKGEKCYSICW